MRLPLLALLILVVPLCAKNPTRTGEQLLDDAIVHPGGYNQMCMLPPPVNADVPLPLYGLRVSRHFHLSRKTADVLLARRAEVVAALSHRFDTMDLAKPAVPKKPRANDGKAVGPMESGYDPQLLSGVLIEVALSLNAVEALPGMLKVEAQLTAIIEAAENDAAAPVPDLPVDGIMYPPEISSWERTSKGGFKEKTMTKALERGQALLRCRVYQRELLSVMAKLMRDARFQPLLNSAIERPYGDALKKNAKSDELKAIKRPDDIPNKDRPWTHWDPIYNLPASAIWPKPEMPFNPEVRAQIRGFVERFIKENPAK